MPCSYVGPFPGKESGIQVLAGIFKNPLAGKYSQKKDSTKLIFENLQTYFFKSEDLTDMASMFMNFIT
jgi:hypothetical protein